MMETDANNKPILAEIIVVEGLHDKYVVDAAVTADVWVIGGDRIAYRFIQELIRASKTRGIIILTDPDGPGERIRRRLSDAIPTAKHAFLRSEIARNEDRVGIEYANPLDVRNALLHVRDATDAKSVDLFTMDDLRDAGMVGMRDSALRRKKAGDILQIGYGNTKAFLRKLNVLGVTKSEWEDVLGRIEEDKR